LAYRVYAAKSVPTTRVSESEDRLRTPKVFAHRGGHVEQPSGRYKNDALL